ncbi:protein DETOXIFICATION 14-like isoform X2 [Rhododendron vialii]|uniref:protein DETOXIFICATION 14-like isoform X2 n=1 Tax=Rhododendron vialii TaxID=182163 RepID=UPI00265D8ACC|nr:protein DETOXIFICATION 14-like isoform X2 [Rhododendron vialii]
MEEALLLKNGDRKLVPIAPKAFVEELKKVTAIAAPMVMVNMSQHLLRVTPMIMLGMAGALETLCGQAYGAEQYKKLGTYTNGAILSLILVCLPISLLWIFMDKLLVFFGQDPIVSLEAGKYAIWLIPSLFPYAILESMVPYLQTQSLILPMLLCSIVTLSFHIPLCWALVFKSGLGTKGAALAISLSYWVDAIALGLYLKYSPACEKSRVPFSRDVFLSIGEFFRFALPSAGMVCLEWWSFELLVLLSGLLPNPELESSVLSICLTTTSLHSLIPYSIGAAASTRVSNELGAGNSRAAQLSVCTVMVLAVAEAIMVCAALFCCRFILGYAYSSEKEVVDYVREMTPLLCLSIVMDSITEILSGIARGSGWQHIGAYANFGAYYLVGIPLAIVLGFLQKLRGEGIWGGIVTGTILQVILLTSATCLTNWQEQANKAKERIFKGRILDDKLIDQLN